MYRLYISCSVHSNNVFRITTSTFSALRVVGYR